MKQIVKLLSVCLIVPIINGCGQLVFEECVTPDVTEPKIDRGSKNTLLASSKQCMTNYLQMKQYAENLKKSNEVCK